MTDAHRTAIKLLLDKSWSMSAIRKATEESINGYLEDAKKLPGVVTVSISEFDHEYHEVLSSTPVEKVKPYGLIPNGNTAMLDAIGRVCTDFGAELAAIPEELRPGHVILVITTDGEENSSREYSYEDIKKILTRQRAVYSWDILFLAANQDAILTGGMIGIPMASSLSYDASDVGTRSGIAAASAYTASSVQYGSAAFTDEDRRKAKTSK